MNQKFTLILAASLTAFMLIFGGAVAGRMSKAAASAPGPATDEILNQYAQREAEYKARLDEANNALAEAYAQQNTTVVGNTTPAIDMGLQSPTASPVLISPQEAILAAMFAIPRGSVIGEPVLVDYQGVVAYEVTLNLGTVYIDANTGAVLYNSAQNTTVVHSPIIGEHDDHEGNDHD